MKTAEEKKQENSGSRWRRQDTQGKDSAKVALDCSMLVAGPGTSRGCHYQERDQCGRLEGTEQPWSVGAGEGLQAFSKYPGNIKNSVTFGEATMKI